MDGLLGIVRWATGSIEGIAFLEYVIIGFLVILYRKVDKLETKVDNHEKDCIKKFAEGSTKMALLKQCYENLHDDIKEALKK